MQCVKCGGEVWDNRQKKLNGEMKPNAPDFSCKDKQGCGWVQWPPKKGASPLSTPTTQVPPSTPQPGSAPASPSSRDTLLVELYLDSLDRVMAKLQREKLVELFRGEAIAAMAATLFIARSKI